MDQAFCLEAIGGLDAGTRSMRLTPFKCRIAQVEPVRMDFTGGVFNVANRASKTNRETLEEIIDLNLSLNGREITRLATAAGFLRETVQNPVERRCSKDGRPIVESRPRNSKLYRLRGPDD